MDILTIIVISGLITIVVGTIAAVAIAIAQHIRSKISEANERANVSVLRTHINTAYNTLLSVLDMLDRDAERIHKIQNTSICTPEQEEAFTSIH